MPELPEVETVARQLAPLITGTRIESVRIVDPLLGGARKGVAKLTGAKVERVFRLGKQVVIATDAAYLAVHLRMTGRLVFYPRGETPTEKPRFTIITDRGNVHLLDTRRFGTVKVAGDLAQLEPEGIDPTAREFTTERLRGFTRATKQPLKLFLMRQDKLTGIGNIYASEILFEAGLSPRRKASTLSAEKVARLHTATKRVLARAIKHCGTTFSDFQDAHGVTGSYQRYLAVYAREDEPCKACRAPIKRIVQGQRSTFYCANCQR